MRVHKDINKVIISVSLFTIFSKKWQLEIQTMSASTRLSFSTELCEEVLKDTLDTLVSPGSVKLVYLVY